MPLRPVASAPGLGGKILLDFGLRLVPTTYLVPFLSNQEKSLLAFELRNIDTLTDK